MNKICRSGKNELWTNKMNISEKQQMIVFKNEQTFGIKLFQKKTLVFLTTYFTNGRSVRRRT